MNGTPDAREEQAIEHALNCLASSDLAGSPPEGTAGQTLAREYSELLGLLPYELPQERPPAELKARILSRITGSRAGESSTVLRMSPRRERVREAAAPTAEAVPILSYLQPARAPWGTFALAAVLGFCLLGLGFLSAMVWMQGERHERLTYELAGMDQELMKAHRQLDMVTRVAHQVYPMRGTPSRVSDRAPEGSVYVCGHHQRWFLNLRGLEPPGPAEKYCLWFMTDKGPVMGETLDIEESSVQVEAQSMPEGTRGFLITLERNPGPQDEPGLTVMVGENPLKL